jgi:hypothetical protein
MRLGLVAVVAALAGCIDVEFGADVKSLQAVEMTRVLTIDRRMWDMGDMTSLCEDSDITVGREAVVCRAVFEFDTAKPREGETATLFDIRGDALRVEFPVGVRVAEISRGLTENVPKGDVSDASLMGRSVVWRIAGGQILEASVPFAPGATSVEYVVPMLQIRDAPGDIAAKFWAVVRPE